MLSYLLAERPGLEPRLLSQVGQISNLLRYHYSIAPNKYLSERLEVKKQQLIKPHRVKNSSNLIVFCSIYFGIYRKGTFPAATSALYIWGGINMQQQDKKYLEWCGSPLTGLFWEVFLTVASHTVVPRGGVEPPPAGFSDRCYGPQVSYPGI